eukprot:9484839-Pyramimonas_sp.AAC.1
MARPLGTLEPLGELTLPVVLHVEAVPRGIRNPCRAYRSQRSQRNREICTAQRRPQTRSGSQMNAPQNASQNHIVVLSVLPPVFVVTVVIVSDRVVVAVRNKTKIGERRGLPRVRGNACLVHF